MTRHESNLAVSQRVFKINQKVFRIKFRKSFRPIHTPMIWSTDSKHVYYFWPYEQSCLFYFSDVNGECKDTEFQCKSNDRCISDRLVCDRFEDCTDASDECLLSTPAIIGLAVGGVVFFLAVIGIIVCICCYKKRRGNSGSTRNLHDNSVSDYISQ